LFPEFPLKTGRKTAAENVFAGSPLYALICL